jgi:hypothetical protein
MTDKQRAYVEKYIGILTGHAAVFRQWMDDGDASWRPAAIHAETEATRLSRRLDEQT